MSLYIREDRFIVLGATCKSAVSQEAPETRWNKDGEGICVLESVITCSLWESLKWHCSVETHEGARTNQQWESSLKKKKKKLWILVLLDWPLFQTIGMLFKGYKFIFLVNKKSSLSCNLVSELADWRGCTYLEVLQFTLFWIQSFHCLAGK